MKKLITLMLFSALLISTQAQVSITSTSCMKETMMDGETEFSGYEYFDYNSLINVNEAGTIITMTNDRGKTTYYIKEVSKSTDMPVWFYFTEGPAGERVIFTIYINENKTEITWKQLVDEGVQKVMLTLNIENIY